MKGRAGQHLRGGYLDPGKGKKKKERERDGRMDVKGRGGDRGGADETARQKTKKPWGGGESDKGTRAAELKLNPEWREIKMGG